MRKLMGRSRDSLIKVKEGGGKKPSQGLQRQSLTTSHKQANAWPVSQVRATSEVKPSPPPLSSSSTSVFIAEYNI